MFNPNCTGAALTVLAIGGREGRPPHVARLCLLKGRKFRIYANNASSREPGTLKRYCVLIDIERNVSTSRFLCLAFLEGDLHFLQCLTLVVTLDRFEHFGHDGIAEVKLVGNLSEQHDGELSVVAVDETEIGNVKRFAQNLGLIALVASLHERYALVRELCKVTHLFVLSILLTRLLRV